MEAEQLIVLARGEMALLRNQVPEETVQALYRPITPEHHLDGIDAYAAWLASNLGFDQIDDKVIGER